MKMVFVETSILFMNLIFLCREYKRQLNHYYVKVEFSFVVICILKIVIKNESTILIDFTNCNIIFLFDL